MDFRPFRNEFICGPRQDPFDECQGFEIVHRSILAALHVEERWWMVAEKQLDTDPLKNVRFPASKPPQEGAHAITMLVVFQSAVVCSADDARPFSFSFFVFACVLRHERGERPA